MAVYDQWHRSLRDGDQPCGCGTRRTPLYPSAGHKRGHRWQVRWRDLKGRQKKRDFDAKVGSDPNRHADAFDKMIAEQLRARTYVDPAAAEMIFEEYAEGWRKARGLDVERGATVEGFLRNHCYQDPEHPGRTRKGGVPIGQHPLGLLAQRPSLSQAWIQAMPLAGSSRRQVITVARAVYAAAIHDGIIGRDPTQSPSVERVPWSRGEARPWPPERIAAVRDALKGKDGRPGRYAIIPELGAGSGMRQGEMFGLGVGDVQFLGRRPEITVARQVKIVAGQLRFGPVKNRKSHTVPLAPSLGLALAAHLREYPAADVTLPWHDPRDKELHGKPVTVRLVLTAPQGGALRRQDFDTRVWRRALEAAGVTPSRRDGCHALRHTAASVWLRARIDIVRVAAWLGDTPAMVARTYAHLLPDDDHSDGCEAMDAFLASCAPDVPREEDSGTPAQVAGE